MIVKKLIEKVEGEAQLDLSFDEGGLVEDAEISFGFYRGVEQILEGKDALDALVITPRICGICNHAHLIAAVRTIEDGYRNTGYKVEISPKAHKIREFTMSVELIQNHIKWLYLVILPKLEKLTGIQNRENHALKASYLASTVTKALAIFAGQWPHSSYAVPGGVTCDPTYVDVMQAQGFIESAIGFVEELVIGMPIEKYLSIDSVSDLHTIGGDFGKVLMMMGEHGVAKSGKSFDRFIVFGDDMWFRSGKSIVTAIANVDVRYVHEEPQQGTSAKAVVYKDRLYEVGPLARAMVSKELIVKRLHMRYKDSLVTRVFARIHESMRLLYESRNILNQLRLDEPSCTFSSHTRVDDYEGVGITEAARGSLIHKARITNGKIERYDIITPTQWTLSNGYEDSRGVAAEAMRGVGTAEEASFIFRAFDICSVCTTH